MNCCQCQGIEAQFDEKNVARELSAYRTKGPASTTLMLINALQSKGIEGYSLLDIGGGLGAIQHQLLAKGAQTAVDIDASQAYLNAARLEATRLGLADRISFQHGNFVEMAAEIAPADIVTLERVICCYPDMEKLVGLSVARARKLYGLVYPRDVWWVRMGIKMMDYLFQFRKNPFRIFSHSTQAVEAIIYDHGFKQFFYGHNLFWQVAVYAHK